MDLKPISLKVPVDVLERIDAQATEAGLSRTALLLRPFAKVTATLEQIAAIKTLSTVPASVWTDLGNHGPKARDRKMMDHIDTPAKGVVLSRPPNMLDRREHKIEMVTVPSAARKPPEVPGVFKASEMPDAPKPAIGSTRRVMGKDPKSAAPMMLRKERLVRYDEDKAVWEAIKP